MTTPPRLTSVAAAGPATEASPDDGAARTHAVVEWFCSDRGFGQLRIASGELVFVSQRDIQREGFRALDDGQSVTFVAGSDAHGPVARRVAPVADTAAGAIAS